MTLPFKKWISKPLLYYKPRRCINQAEKKVTILPEGISRIIGVIFGGRNNSSVVCSSELYFRAEPVPNGKEFYFYNHIVKGE